MARFEQNFPEILCFIKGEAAIRVYRPPHPVSGEARVTNEVGVLIGAGEIELRATSVPFRTRPRRA